MKNSKLINKIEIKLNSPINLNETFNCGQCFRFNEINDGIFCGVAFGKVLKLCTNGENLVLFNTSQDDIDTYWNDFFDLGLDYNTINKELSLIHPILNEACKFAPGIRILKQDSWEALCSFIISQNNNIKRIKGIIECLCKNFGDKIENNFYTFPSAETLSTLSIDDLSSLKCGFRDKYILNAAKKVASSEISLEQIKTLPLDEARNELMKIKGVGPKVAECTLLYGMHRLEAFPLDVWMKRAMKYLFSDISIDDFGKYAGIAQQYIFHYSRMHPDLFDKFKKEQ